MRILLALTLLAFSAPASAQPDATPATIERTSRIHCARLFPESFSTQLFCLKQNREGGTKWRTMRTAAAADPALVAAIDHCLTLFTEADGGISWSTAAFCAEREATAKRDLNG